MRPGLMLTAGAACALAGTGDLGLLGLLVPRWVAASEAPAAPAPPAPVAVRAPPPAPPPAEAPPADVPPPASAPAGAAPGEVARRPPPAAPAELVQLVADPEPALVVHFPAESVDLDDPAARSLRGLVARLEAGARLRVEGHADASGREEGHQYFSRLRARTVTRRLLQLGVPPASVSSAAFGASRPLDPAHTLEAMARNRRVEVFIDQGRR